MVGDPPGKHAELVQAFSSSIQGLLAFLVQHGQRLRHMQELNKTSTCTAKGVARLWPAAQTPG
jgi:hypothetical protein